MEAWQDFSKMATTRIPAKTKFGQGKSSVTLLPMIDMDPSDMSCVYSTLKYVAEEARRHDVTPVLTFDQPVWWKAQLVIACELPNSYLRNIVLRLGGFHTEMSFLGSIGHIMAGSGLQELLELVYAQNAVGHMLSGKAISRAVRGHLLVDSALNALLTVEAFGVRLPNIHTPETEEEVSAVSDHQEAATESILTDSVPPVTFEADERMQIDVLAETEQIPEDLNSAIQLYDKVMAHEVSVDTVCSEIILETVQQRLQDQRLTNNPTARLWIQYMRMVDLLRQFLKAERTGNWHLHLKSLQEMLPYFVAAGHNLYTKSVHIYLQQMLQLQAQHPDVYAFFRTGYHVICRSDRYWAGLSSDLVIEQVLMISMKATGGLTRSRGMTESQRTRWLLSMPACAEVNSAMQELTETTSTQVNSTKI